MRILKAWAIVAIVLGSPFFSQASEIQRAIKLDQITEVSRLIEAGVDVNEIDGEDKTSCLITAVKTDNPTVVSMLLKAKADVHYADHLGNNALTWASWMHLPNSLEITKILTVALLVDGQNFLEAVERKDLSEARRHLEKGTHVDYRDAESHGTALMIAAKNDDLEMVRLLLQWEAQPQLRNRQDKNALQFAREVNGGNSRKIMKMLFNAKQNQRKTGHYRTLSEPGA
jgi:ankyrin repeat protein